MSPEQCSQASGIDARSDIYSLGIIIYEMLVGHVPFTGESATAIMLKHLQEPPPSVLDERKDLPPAVGQVIARALSKLPEERQESAGELAEALANAAEDASSAAAVAAGGGTTSEQAQLGAGNTNRIVVPTAPLESRHTTSEEQDEATIVHAREQSYVADDHELLETPPPVASFNPWRIMIPAAVLLVVLLGVFFAFQRNSDSSATNDNSQPLVADPNASPVQPGASPTGAGESNIAPSTGAPVPSATVPAQTSTGAGGTTVNSNSSTEATPTPTPAQDDPQNTNSPQEEDDPEPTPSATPRRSATPSPTRTPPSDDPPPPSPKATPPPTLSTPAEDPPPVDNWL
jgi:serine/threonine-protein kinase